MYDKKGREKLAKEVMREVKAASPHLYRGRDAIPWCCEVTLGALQTVTPMRIDRLEEVTFGIGAGFSEQGEVCGAVSGHIIAIGLDVVSRIRETARIRQEICEESWAYCERFKKKFGSLRCRDLIGYSLRDPVEVKAYLADEEKLKLCEAAMMFSIIEPLPSELKTFKRDILGL